MCKCGVWVCPSKSAQKRYRSVFCLKMGNAESAPGKEEEGEACAAPPCTVPMLDFGELQAQLATNYKKDNMAWNMGGTFWAGADGNIHFVAHDSEAGSKFGAAASCAYERRRALHARVGLLDRVRCCVESINIDATSRSTKDTLI